MNHVNVQAAIHDFKVAKLPVRQIAKKQGVSHTAVTKHLNRAGIKTARRLNGRSSPCAHCGQPVYKAQHAMRRYSRRYCSSACYFQHRANPAYRENRHGQRIGRTVVSALFGPLPPGSVVHHHDGDNLNNDPANLALFASQSDHLSYHHSGLPHPVWDGKISKNSAGALAKAPAGASRPVRPPTPA